MSGSHTVFAPARRPVSASEIQPRQLPVAAAADDQGRHVDRSAGIDRIFGEGRGDAGLHRRVRSRVPAGGGSTIWPAMMASMAFAIGASFSGGSCLFELRLEQVALPPCGGGQQHQPVDRDAPRGQDRDQAALAVSDQTTFENFRLPRR